LTAAEAWGGQNLPNVIGTAVSEIWHSANMAFALCPMLNSIGDCDHGSPALREAYLSKLVSGEWTGT
jgi:alkylation response protein AidB-like acyl-CoA dehydrogenase